MNEWINVNDRMPIGGTRVLAYCTGCVFKENVVTSHNDGIGGLYFDAFMKVTHWMPLPEAP